MSKFAARLAVWCEFRFYDYSNIWRDARRKIAMTRVVHSVLFLCIGCLGLIMFSESASPSMSGDERMSRSDEVFLLLVDIPVDVGPVLERGYDPDRVAEAIKKFDRFSNEDLSIGIRKYWQHDGSDEFTDAMVKLFLVNAYLFDVPRRKQIDGDLLSAGVPYFIVPWDNQLADLQFPWQKHKSKGWILTESILSTNHISGLGYNGPAAFEAYRKRFKRRVQH